MFLIWLLSSTLMSSDALPETMSALSHSAAAQSIPLSDMLMRSMESRLEIRVVFVPSSNVASVRWLLPSMMVFCFCGRMALSCAVVPT